MPLTPSEIAVLKSSLGFWEKLEYFATAGVILGVVGEYIADFTKFSENNKLEKPLGKVSTLVLIIALAVELLSLVRSNQVSGRLIASLEEQAGQALREGESAKATAKEFEAQIAKATEEAERERLARVQLQSQLAPRRLTGKQSESVANELRSHPDSVAIVSTMLDGEGSDFADDLDAAIRSASWHTTRIRNHLGSESGVSLGSVAGTSLPGAKRLRDALSGVGIRCREVVFRADDKSMSPYFQSGVIYLVIERKPALAFDNDNLMHVDYSSDDSFKPCE